jgi:hypothetical protein
VKDNNAFDFLDWALRQPIQNRGTKLVLVGLARHAGNGGKDCRPTHAMLAGYAGCGQRRVRDHLTRLRDGGLVSWKPINTRGGRIGNLYRLHIEKGAQSPPADGGPVDTGSPVAGTGSPAEDVVGSPPEDVVEPTGNPIAAKEHSQGTLPKEHSQGTSPAREKSPAGKRASGVKSVPPRSSSPLGGSGGELPSGDSLDNSARQVAQGDSVAPDPSHARKVLAQAKAEGVYTAAIPAGDQEAIDAAGELVAIAHTAWRGNVRGAEVASILAVAHGVREPTTEPIPTAGVSDDVEAVKDVLTGAVA